MLILHIGLERTGTTSLQRFCADHRRRLRKASILYPTRSLAYGGSAWRNHVPLSVCYFDDQLRDLSIPFGPERKALVLASLFREIASSGADLALVSSEHFSSRLRLPQVRELASDLAGYETRIGVVVRDHVSRFFSSYSTHVLGGGVTELNGYADGVLSPESIYFRYAETIRPWEEAFGKQNVGIFAYDRKFDVLRTLLKRFAPSELNAPPLADYGENFSYGPFVTEAFRRANLMATERRSWSNSPADWARRRFVNFLLREWLKTTTIDPRAGVWSLDGDRMAQLNALAEADRRWLRQERGVSLSDEVTQAARAEQSEFRTEEFIARANAFWRLTDVVHPVLAAARLADRTMRLARNALGL